MSWVIYILEMYLKKSDLVVLATFNKTISDWLWHRGKARISQFLFFSKM